MWLLLQKSELWHLLFLLVCLNFWMIAIVTEWAKPGWNTIIIFIFFFLAASDLEHLLKCLLVTCIAFFGRCLLILLVHFLTILFVSLVFSFLNSLYILGINPSPVVQLENVFLFFFFSNSYWLSLYFAVYFLCWTQISQLDVIPICLFFILLPVLAESYAISPSVFSWLAVFPSSNFMA